MGGVQGKTFGGQGGWWAYFRTPGVASRCRVRGSAAAVGEDVERVVDVGTRNSLAAMVFITKADAAEWWSLLRS